MQCLFYNSPEATDCDWVIPSLGPVFSFSVMVGLNKVIFKVPFWSKSNCFREFRGAMSPTCCWSCQHCGRHTVSHLLPRQAGDQGLIKGVGASIFVKHQLVSARAGESLASCRLPSELSLASKCILTVPICGVIELMCYVCVFFWKWVKRMLFVTFPCLQDGWKSGCDYQPLKGDFQLTEKCHFHNLLLPTWTQL